MPDPSEYVFVWEILHTHSKEGKKEKVGWSDFLYELKKDCSADKLFLPKKLFSADRVTR
jgi:hypothetical protein